MRVSGRLAGPTSLPSNFWPQNSPVSFCGSTVSFLPGSPVVRQLRQAVIIVSGQDGWFQSTVP